MLLEMRGLLEGGVLEGEGHHNKDGGVIVNVKRTVGWGLVSVSSFVSHSARNSKLETSTIRNVRNNKRVLCT